MAAGDAQRPSFRPTYLLCADPNLYRIWGTLARYEIVWGWWHQTNVIHMLINPKYWFWHSGDIFVLLCLRCAVSMYRAELSLYMENFRPFKASYDTHIILFNIAHGHLAYHQSEAGDTLCPWDQRVM